MKRGLQRVSFFRIFVCDSYASFVVRHTSNHIIFLQLLFSLFSNVTVLSSNSILPKIFSLVSAEMIQDSANDHGLSKEKTVDKSKGIVIFKP
jgi:hypothetical protein